jgi:hypothetical protein
MTETVYLAMEGEALLYDAAFRTRELAQAAIDDMLDGGRGYSILEVPVR